MVPQLFTLLLPLIAAAGAADTGGGTCDEWGEVYPAVADVYLGEFLTFRVSGGRACGDVATCSWWTDGNQGDFLQSTGSPVTWRAPTELEDCVAKSFRLWSSCTDGSTTGFADITVRCTYEQLIAVQENRKATVTGGGCGGPVYEPGSSSGDTSGAALFGLPLLGFLRRRRRS